MLGLLALTNWEIQQSFDDNSLPNWQQLMATIVFCVLCEDAYFYFSHKIMHWAPIYPYVHKVHHDHIVSFNLASEHLHPIEFIFAALLPASLGLLILGTRMHFYTVIIWNIWRVCETNFLHSGYEFSWTPFDILPLMVSSSYHDFHHRENIGNYGQQFIILDLIFGDCIPYFDYLDRQES